MKRLRHPKIEMMASSWNDRPHWEQKLLDSHGLDQWQPLLRVLRLSGSLHWSVKEELHGVTASLNASPGSVRF